MRAVEGRDADITLAAAAKTEGMTLLTSDSILRDYPAPVIYIARHGEPISEG